MRKYNFLIFFATISFVVVSCNPTPDITDDMLDSGQFSYAISDSLERHLVSEYVKNPTDEQKNTPVIIASHGYSATTFEWDEFRAFADSAKTFYVSQVLLGGHGTSYTDFKAAGWEDWQTSIKDEYKKLSDMGFTKIYLAGSSTGAPLIINLLKSGFFQKYTAPKAAFFIDPIIVSANKTLTLIGLLGPVLGYSSVELTDSEAHRWYVYRPQETLNELQKLIDLTRRDLQKGINVTEDFYMKIYKSKSDDVADPVSALMIYKGIKYDWLSYKTVDVELVNSNLHVFTRLRGRAGVTQADVELQQRVFHEIENKMLE